LLSAYDGLGSLFSIRGEAVSHRQIASPFVTHNSPDYSLLMLSVGTADRRDFQSITEWVLAEETRAVRDRRCVFRLDVSLLKPGSDCLDVVNSEAEVPAAGLGIRVIFLKQVQLTVACLKPDHSTSVQRVRLWNFAQTQDISIECTSGFDLFWWCRNTDVVQAHGESSLPAFSNR
jgi:hypothetical protein